MKLVCDSIKNNHYEYFDIFIELFYRHPNPNKIIGLCDIQIKKNPVYKHLELHIIYDNGSSDDISYNVCVSGKQKSFIKMAMRISILEQILEFKNNNIQKCLLCNSTDKLEVDHIIWFEQLYEDFIKNNKIEIPTEFDNTTGNIKCFKKEDVEFENSWKKYHCNNAELRMLCKKCNLTREKYKK